MSHAFPNLFSSIRFGSLEAPTRLWYAPLTAAYAHPDGTVSHAEIEHYARRARGGVSVVLTEHFSVNEAGRQLPQQTVVDGPAKLPGLRALADAVHAEGALIVAQVGHAGRYAGPWDRYEERPRLAPSAREFRLVGDRMVTPTAMSGDDIAETLDDFGTSAALLAEAGFDGLLLHASQGFLPSQFLSPRMNDRSDRYGGGFENRIRFVLEAFDRLDRGFGIPGRIGVQLLADDVAHGGWTLHEGVELSLRLVEQGATFLMPTVTTFETLRGISTPGERRRWAHQLAAAIAIQGAVDVPVVANGGLADAARIDAYIADGLVQVAALARPIFSNPDWAADAALGQAVPSSCICNPPSCLRTQLSGAICSHWPQDRQDAGFWGREPAGREPVDPKKEAS